METINPEAVCCPPFDSAPWDDVLTSWDNKLFIKEKVATFFYIPLGFGKAMTKLNNLVEKADAKMPDWLCLSQHTSKWNMDLLLAVDREIADAENLKLTGNFYSKVYEGNYNDTGKWTADFEQLCSKKGYSIEKLYMWYTTCPKCAKKYGKNFTVLIAKI
jgi:hypothetical protein